MRDFLKEHPDPVYRSYVWGFVCHYSLDCTAHPYVNWLAVELAKQRPWETPSTMHGEIESALDAIILRFETGKLPSEVPLKEMFPKNEPVQRKIAHLYHHVFLSLYGEDVPEELLVQAMSDAHVVFSLVTDQDGLETESDPADRKGKAQLHFQPPGSLDGERRSGLCQPAKRTLGGWGFPPKLF